MMRQPGNSRLFCVCTFDCGFMQDNELNDSTGFSRKVVGEADFRLFAALFMRGVCVHEPIIFCFTQGSPNGWPPGS
jgi:hypothetical protein